MHHTHDFKCSGAIRTIKSGGRINKIIGMVRVAGKLGALASAAIIRSSRISPTAHAAIRERRAIFLSLNERVGKRGDALQRHAVSQILQRLGTFGQEAEFDGGEADFFGKLRACRADFALTRSNVASRLRPASAQ